MGVTAGTPPAAGAALVVAARAVPATATLALLAVRTPPSRTPRVPS